MGVTPLAPESAYVLPTMWNHASSTLHVKPYSKRSFFLTSESDKQGATPVPTL